VWGRLTCVGCRYLHLQGSAGTCTAVCSGAGWAWVELAVGWSRYRLTLGASAGQAQDENFLCGWWNVEPKHTTYCCNLSGGVALIVWFTTSRMCVWCCVDCVIHHEQDVREEQHHTYMWREQAITEWSRRVNSIVACCHGAKLCAHAAWHFWSQHYQLKNSKICGLLKLFASIVLTA